MPVKLGGQFNRPVVDLMNNGQSQALQIKIGSSKAKAIHGLNCSYCNQANIGGVPVDAQTALSNQFVQGRIVIIGEDIDLSAFTAAQILAGFNPFQAPIEFGTMRLSNILYDVSFINEYNVDFNTPFLIADGVEVSILMSAGFSPVDVGLGNPGARVGFLNVRGDIVSEIGSRFPFDLR